jgi:hypothetical protein
VTGPNYPANPSYAKRTAPDDASSTAGKTPTAADAMRQVESIQQALVALSHMITAIDAAHQSATGSTTTSAGQGYAPSKGVAEAARRFGKGK